MHDMVRMNRAIGLGNKTFGLIIEDDDPVLLLWTLERRKNKQEMNGKMRASQAS